MINSFYIMGANATKSQNTTTTTNKSKFEIDLAKQTKIIINTVNNVSQKITSESNTNQNTNATISITNANIDGSLNITNTVLAANSLVNISIYNTNDFVNDLNDSLAQQFEDTLKNQFNSLLTPETIKNVVTASGVNADSAPAVSVNTNISKDEKFSEVISSFIDKSKTEFKNNASNNLSQTLKTQINQSFETSASIILNNVNIGSDVNINAVNLSAISKITSNIIIKDGLVDTFIDNIKNDISNVADVTTVNKDSSKVSTENDINSSTSASLDGLIKGLQAIFAMPVNLLSILVFGIVAVIAILGVVIVLIIKYLTASPESLNIIADVIKTGANKSSFPGKGSYNDIVEPTLNVEYLKKIDSLLSFNQIRIESSMS